VFSMRDKKKNDSKPTKTDLLIEEAVRAVESHETESETSTELQSKDAPSKDSGAIARIDLQQFVEKEAYLRLAADFENFRRRAVKDRQDAEKSGREKILRGFLEILDNLDRGLSQATDESGPLADGIRMVLSQVDTWLKSEGLFRVESVGQVFDPAVHEAISQESSLEVPSGTIIREIRRGYRWADRLLRPAAVIVSKGSEEIK